MLSVQVWAWIILFLGNPLLDGFLLIQELCTVSMRSFKIGTLLMSSSVSVNHFGGGKLKKLGLAHIQVQSHIT